MTESELAFNITGWAITAGLAMYGAAIIWLHTWLRTIERHEGEDNDEETDYLLSSPANAEHLLRSLNDFTGKLPEGKRR